MRKYYRLVPLALTLVLIVSMGNVATKAQDTGGVIIEGNAGGDVQTLNPLLTQSDTDQEVAGFLFPGLVGVDPKTGNSTAPGKFPGAMAETWEISKDGKTYTFHLRKDFKWTDGQPVTANDYKYSYDATVSGKVDSPLTGPTQERIASVTAPDDYTLVVTFKDQSCTALSDVGFIQVIPAHVFKPDFSDINDSPFNLSPTTTAGVFKFKEFRPSEQVTLVADQNYPDAEGGKVKPEGFILKNVPDQTVALEQFLAGQTNLHRAPPVGRRSDVKANANLQVFDYPGNAWDYISWNLADPTNPQSAMDDKGNPTNADQGHHPFFGDVRVRKALALGTNVDQMIKLAVFGEGTRMASSLVPSSWALDKDLKPLPYDPAAAGKMLDDAGFPMGPDGIRVAKGAMYAKDGTPFKFTLYTNEGNARRTAAGQVFQDNMKQLGVVVDFQPIDFNTLIAKQNAQTFDATLLGWRNGYPDDPDQTTLFTPAGDIVNAGQNFVSYDNPEFTKLESDAQHLLGCDPKARADIYKKTQKILQDDQPYMFLYVINGEYAANKSIAGFSPYPSNLFWNVDQWTVKAAAKTQ